MTTGVQIGRLDRTGHSGPSHDQCFAVQDMLNETCPTSLDKQRRRFYIQNS